MRRVLIALRSGAWVTRERVRLVALALLAASVFAVGYLAATSDGRNDRQGRPLGTDFSSFYAAGTSALEGKAAAPYDPAAHHAREQAIFGAATPFYSWLYPPLFLLLAAALAALPYWASLLVWQGGTLALYLAAMRAVVCGAALRGSDRLWLLLALAFPAVLVNLGHGQNGFLSAALLAGGLALLDRRPLLAGVLFGCLAYKPQLAFVIPVALAAGGRWRTFLAAGASVVALAAATLAIFGLEAWTAFFAATGFARAALLESGGVGWHKIQSVFALVRMWGGSVPQAYAFQAVASLLVLCVLAWIWRGRAPFEVKAASLCLAAILGTPFSLDYDLMLLAPAIAFLALHGLRDGFAPYEKSALAGLWLAPAVARSLAEAVVFPAGVLAIVLTFALVLRRALAEGRATSEVSRASVVRA